MKVSLFLLLTLITGMCLRLYNLLYFHHMTADESVYVQAVFTMTKGYFPYRDVSIMHPLLYFLIEYPFIRLNPSLLMARSISVLLSFGTMLLIFPIVKLLYHSDRVAVFATVLFALSPYAIHHNKLAIVDNTSLFFTTVLLYFFFKYYKNDSEKYLLLSGLFAGVAFVSKYTTLFVVVALMLFIALKRGFKSLTFFVMAASIVPSAFLLLLSLFNLHYYWYVQTVSFQFIRFSLPLPLKVFWLGIFFGWALPLFVVAVPTMVHRKTGEDSLLTLFYLMPFLIAFGGVFGVHHPLMLTPILCILGGRGLDKYFLGRGKKRVLLILMIFLIHLCVYGYTFMGSAQMESAVRMKMEVADYIRSITEEGDKIWTTEADIAFFAQRIIVTPNSKIWRYQGFYEDVWGYMGESYVGQFAGYQGGLITLDEIRQTLESEKPKVVVIMKNKFTDRLIWYGIDNPAYREEGLSEYILAHYELGRSLHDIEIYVRR